MQGLEKKPKKKNNKKGAINMGILVGMGAQCVCSMGLTPTPLMILPQKKVFGENKPIATAQDNKPMVNIMPFGICKSPANPGVKPPVMQGPCVPNTAAPWAPCSSTVFVGGVPALTNNSKLVCNYGGVISIMNPGITKVMVK